MTAQEYIANLITVYRTNDPERFHQLAKQSVEVDDESGVIAKAVKETFKEPDTLAIHYNIDTLPAPKEPTIADQVLEATIAFVQDDCKDENICFEFDSKGKAQYYKGVCQKGIRIARYRARKDAPNSRLGSEDPQVLFSIKLKGNSVLLMRNKTLVETI